MSRDVSYSLWITIQISHTYFKSKRCDLNLVPTAKTKQLLFQSGLILKQYDPCTWILLKPAREQDQVRIEMFFEDEPVLLFDMKNQSPDFYYYTEMEQTKEGGSWNWAYIGRNGVYGRLDINISKELLREKGEIKLDIKSKIKIWEFILIPKFDLTEKTLKLLESKKRLSFSYVGKVSIPGQSQTALRFVTDKAYELNDSYDFKIALWEVKSNGEYLLSSRIPYPKPQSISIFNPENTITSYYYY